MTGRTLTLAAGLVLAADAQVNRLAFVGTTNSGKTYAATKLAELMWDAGMQFVALDVMGIWWGMRLSGDGEGEGIPIAIFGGKHGDVPITEEDGALVADIVFEQRISAIVDISEFETDAQKNRFAARFAERIYSLHKKSPRACHLFLEEAHEYLPQNPQGGDAHMLHVWNRLWKQGGNFGLGGSIITQRPQDVSKKATDLSACVFAFNVTGTNALDAMKKWMGSAETSRLPELQKGECVVWSPSWLQLSGTFKIDAKATFHARFDPLSAMAEDAPVRTLAPLDLSLVRDRLSRAAEERVAEIQERIRKVKSSADESDDPALLRDEIERLKKDAITTTSRLTEADVQRRIAEALLDHDATISVQRQVLTSVRAVLAQSALDIEEVLDWAPIKPDPPVAVATRQLASSAPERTPAQPKAKPEPVEGDTKISGPQQAILNTLANLAVIRMEKVRKDIVALFSGASPNRCGHCGMERPVFIWQECDDNDQPTPVRVALCRTCSEEIIEPHDRLYDALPANCPMPGCIDICVGCVHLDRLTCRSPLLKLNGGPGLPVRHPKPNVQFIDGRDAKTGRRWGKQVLVYPIGTIECDGRQASGGAA